MNYIIRKSKQLLIALCLFLKIATFMVIFESRDR